MSSSARQRTLEPALRSEAGLGSLRRIATPDRLSLLGAVLIPALLLRLPSLGSTSLWLDEMWSIATARLPWRSLFWVAVYRDSNASLYYALLHMWLRLGSGEASVRILSVVLGVATIPVLYVLGNRLLGKPVGLIAALLLTVNKLHVAQSQDARTYTLVVLLITISSLYFVRSIEEPSTKNWCGYVLVSVLAVYAHVFAVLVLGAHWASVAFLRRREVPWRGLLASAGAITVLTSPVGILLHARMHEPGAPLDWAPPVSVGVVGRFFWALAGGSHFGFLWALVAGIALCLVYYGLYLVSLVRGLRLWREAGPSLESWRLGFVLCWFLLPVTLAIVVSTSRSVLIDKYLIVCLPALVLGVAKGIASLRPKWSAAASVSLVALAVLALLPYWHMRHQDREWQGATGAILSQARPGDAIIFMVAPGRLLFDYYRGENRAAGQSPVVLYPQYADEFANPSSLEYMPPLNGSSLTGAAQRYRRIWLVLYHVRFASTDPLRQRIESSLSANYQPIQASQFDGTPNFEQVRVVLYASGDPIHLGERAPDGGGIASPPELAAGSRKSISGAAAVE